MERDEVRAVPAVVIPARMLIVLVVAIALSALLHYYLYARLVRDPAWPVAVRAVLGSLLVVLTPLPILGMVSSRLFPRSIAAPFGFVAMTWMGLLFLAVVSVAALDFARMISLPFVGEALREPSRRRFLARVVAGVAAASAGVLGVIATREALGRVRVKNVRVPMSKLASSLSGYRIVQLSDVHVGPTIGRAFLADVVSRTNALAPDLVVITGDLVDGSVAELAEHVAPLVDLRAKDGVFFVTGNHEYYSGADAWIAHLETLGVRVLRNERVAIRGAEGFDLAGVDDYRARDVHPTHGPDLSAALAGRDESRALVLLAHQPKQFAEALEKGVCLQLSGHTHGGQIFPFSLLVRLEQPFLAGLERFGRQHLYVSRGTGYWGPPMRLRAPAEITAIELVQSAS